MSQTKSLLCFVWSFDRSPTTYEDYLLFPDGGRRRELIEIDSLLGLIEEDRKTKTA